LNPTGVVSVDSDPITDNDLVQIVTIDYDEAMAAGSTPTITFTGASATFTTQGDGSWDTATQWTETFDVSDANENEEVAVVTVSSADATDVDGNAEGVCTSTTFEIDTLNPTPTLAVSVDPIYEEALTQTVTVTYDEPMNTATNPVITFTSTQFISDSDGAWTGNTVWTENFTHDGTQETIASEAATIAAGIGPTDLVGNPENAGASPTFVLDTEKPTITSIQADPFVALVGENVNISCDVTDIMGIDKVNVTVSGPSGFPTINTSMDKNGGDTYYYNEIYTILGIYNYSIWFEIVAQLQITTMLDKWNFVSLPFNQSITKDDLMIINNSIEYNWTEAYTAGAILPFIYDWNRTSQSYPGDTSTLEPGYGYWMYSYYDNVEVWAKGVSVYTVDGYITDLEDRWNTIGIPDDQTVTKDDLIIIYDGGPYNWTEADTAGIILPFIYDWDRTDQSSHIQVIYQLLNQDIAIGSMHIMTAD